VPTTPIQPYIEVQDAAGNWVYGRHYGMGKGDLKTMVIELYGLLAGASQRIRLHYGLARTKYVIDAIGLDDSPPPASLVVRDVQAGYADLHHRGRAIFFTPDYTKRIAATDGVMPDNPAGYQYGNYTAYGDVRPLMTAADDMYAIMREGDEIELVYDVSSLPPPDPGMTRQYVYKADAFFKAVTYGTYITPLPYHGMTTYPYTYPLQYPTDQVHQDYLTNYNTRVLSP
jgi:hypothetical protein